MTKCFGNLYFINKQSIDRLYTTARYDCKGERILAGSVNGSILVLESKTLAVQVLLYDQTNEDDNQFAPVSSIATFPARRAGYGHWCIATYANGFLKLWNIEEEKCSTTLNENRLILGVKINSNIPNFATYGGDSNIFIYDENTMTVKQTHTISPFGTKKEGHIGNICTLVFNPQNNNEFLTAGWDNTIHFWDLRKANASRYISGLNITGDGLDFSPNGKEILTCSYQKHNSLQKWDYTTGKLLLNYEVDLFFSKLNCGRWFDQDFIATGGCDPTVFRVVDLGKNKTVGYYRSLHSGISSFDTFPDNLEISKESDEQTERPSRGSTASYPGKQEVPNNPTGKVFKIVSCVNRNLIETRTFLPQTEE